MIRRFTLSAVLLILPAAACSTQPQLQEASGTAEILRPVTFEVWQETLADNKGAITVVDFWATWCAPCRERFPHMVALHARYKDRGVRFISMSLDDRDDKGAIGQAKTFLMEQKATFENYLIDENITDAFEKLDLLSIPAVLIYDRDGRLRYKLTADDPNNQFTSEDVDRAIEDLLRATG